MIFPHNHNQTNQMKLTIEIPNEHAHALLSLLANLTATKPEPVADPAPGHPELPLGRFYIKSLGSALVDEMHLYPDTPEVRKANEIADAAFRKTAQVGMPSEQYMAARMAEGELEEIGSLNTPDLAAKWIAAGGDVPPTPEQLAALAARTRDDEDPALADVRWQATPEAAPEPEPWDEPTPTETDEFNSDPTRREIAWPLEISVTELPDLPEGKTQWVYRGTFEGKRYECTDDRSVFFYSSASKFWSKSIDFSTSLHHIEAI